MKIGKTLNKAIATSPMRRMSPPSGGKTAAFPISKVDNTDAMLDALRNRVNELEERLAKLESAVSVVDQDVVINANGSVLIQGLGTVEINTSMLKAAASTVEFNTPMTKATGVVTCDTVVCTTVTAATYTPAAGNVW